MDCMFENQWEGLCAWRMQVAGHAIKEIRQATREEMAVARDIAEFRIGVSN